MKMLAMVGLLAASTFVDSAAAPGEKPPVNAVSIELSISVEEYDPYVPSKGVLKCVLNNNSTQPVRAPLGYDGSTAVLHGGLVTLAPPKAPTKDELKTVAVDPGKDEILFTLPLDDILLQGDKPSGDWYWNWMRPASGAAPDHPFAKYPEGRLCGRGGVPGRCGHRAGQDRVQQGHAEGETEQV